MKSKRPKQALNACLGPDELRKAAAVPTVQREGEPELGDRSHNYLQTVPTNLHENSVNTLTDNDSKHLQEFQKKTKSALDKTGGRAFSFDRGPWDEPKQQQLMQSGMKYVRCFH